MLGGRDEDRMAKAAESYNKGYAEYVMITSVSDVPLNYQSVEDAVYHGIPERHLILEYDARST